MSSERPCGYSGSAREALRAALLARSAYGRRGRSRRSVEEAARLAMLARELLEDLVRAGVYEIRGRVVRVRVVEAPGEKGEEERHLELGRSSEMASQSFSSASA